MWRARQGLGQLLGPASREQADGRLDQRERFELTFAVPLFDGAAFEGSVAVEQDGHVVVGVVAEPDGDAGGGVVAEVFPGAPDGFEAADGFGMAPPFGAPGALGAVERAAVQRRELLAHELLQRRVEQLRRLLLAARAGGGRGDELVAPGGHAGPPPAAAGSSRAPAPSSALEACSSVVVAAGSCSRSETRISLARGPVIHGSVRTSVGGAPAASTIARPLA